MIYEQILPSKGTKLEKVKRTFQIVGLLHFLFSFVAFVCLLFIYWKLALFALIVFAIGIAWGAVAYIFSFEYKYIYKDGTFYAYKLNSYNKFILKATFEVCQIKFVEPQKVAVCLTNLKNKVYVEYKGQVYQLSPNDYMLSLLQLGSDK